MRNTHAGSLRGGSVHHSSWPILMWMGQGSRSIETHPPGVMEIYSPGDRSRKKRK